LDGFPQKVSFGWIPILCRQPRAIAKITTKTTKFDLVLAPIHQRFQLSLLFEKYLGWWRRVGGERWFRQKVVLKKTIFSVIVDGVKQEMEGGGK
jgi:hypothetical protein